MSPGTEFARDFCAGIGPLQLGVVLVIIIIIIIIRIFSASFCFRNGSNRYITVTKKTTGLGKWTPDVFSFTKNELSHVNQLLHKFPLSDKEREELAPITQKQNAVNEGDIIILPQTFKKMQFFRFQR